MYIVSKIALTLALVWHYSPRHRTFWGCMLASLLWPTSLLDAAAVANCATSRHVLRLILLFLSLRLTVKCSIPRTSDLITVKGDAPGTV